MVIFSGIYLTIFLEATARFLRSDLKIQGVLEPLRAGKCVVVKGLL